MRRPGEMKSLSREIPAPAALGVGMIRVPEGSPIDIDLRLESVSEGVLATGVVSADLVGECARCLGEVSDHRDFDLQDLYYYPGRPAEEDSLFIVDDHIDLEPPMRDAIVLSCPSSQCRDDCLGLCPQCGFAPTTIPAIGTSRRSIRDGRRPDCSTDHVDPSVGVPAPDLVFCGLRHRLVKLAGVRLDGRRRLGPKAAPANTRGHPL